MPTSHYTNYCREENGTYFSHILIYQSWLLKSASCNDDKVIARINKPPSLYTNEWNEPKQFKTCTVPGFRRVVYTRLFTWIYTKASNAYIFLCAL